MYGNDFLEKSGPPSLYKYSRKIVASLPISHGHNTSIVSVYQNDIVVGEGHIQEGEINTDAEILIII